MKVMESNPTGQSSSCHKILATNGNQILRDMSAKGSFGPYQLKEPEWGGQNGTEVAFALCTQPFRKLAILRNIGVSTHGKTKKNLSIIMS